MTTDSFLHTTTPSKTQYSTAQSQPHTLSSSSSIVDRLDLFLRALLLSIPALFPTLPRTHRLIATPKIHLLLLSRSPFRIARRSLSRQLFNLVLRQQTRPTLLGLPLLLLRLLLLLLLFLLPL